MIASAGQPLHGRGILVTRPAGTAEPLCELIRTAGGEALRFPSIEILPAADPVAARALLSPASLAQQDMVIFVSPTAVSMAFTLMQGVWPQGPVVAAVGKGTARALREHDVPRALVPEGGADSEALAALPALQAMQGRKVLIVRGEGGRDWLAETLRARGATVSYVECYRRAVPSADVAPMAARWKTGAIAATAVTSREAFDNLLLLFADMAKVVLATPLFASHPRIAEHARQRGFTQVISCQPGDEAMVAEMARFFRAR